MTSEKLPYYSGKFSRGTIFKFHGLEQSHETFSGHCMQGYTCIYMYTRRHHTHIIDKGLPETVTIVNYKGAACTHIHVLIFTVICTCPTAN